MVKNLPAMQETQLHSLGGEDPLEEGMATLEYSCLGNSMDRVVWQAIQSMGLQRVGCGWHFHFFCLCNSRCHVLQTCEWAESWRSFYSQS